ncbi:MAG: mechanosensitive ion channel domain-containing protein [Myxococcales bacterium]
MARPGSGWAAAAAVILLPLAAARAATPATPGEAPAPVPSAQLLREAETAYTEIRRISDLAGTDTALDELAGRISRVEREFARLRSAGRSAGMADAEFLQAELARRDAAIRRWDDQLERRGHVLDGSVTSLRRLTSTWRLTVSSLDASTPPALAARALDVRDRASALQEIVEKRLASLLALQDRLLAVKLSSADMLASVQAADAARTQELFEVESTPLWDSFGPGRPIIAPQRWRAFAVHGRNCVRYVASAPGRCLAHLLLLVALIAVARTVVRGRPRTAPAGSAFDAVEVLSKHPIASAILIALVATPLLHPTAPAPFSLLLLLFGMVPFFRIASALVPAWGRPLKGLAVLFFAERLATGAPDLAPLGRLVLLAIDLFALTACGLGLRRGGFLHVRFPVRLRAAVLALGATACVLLATAAVANVFGNVTLSQLLTSATLASTCVNVAAAAAVVVFTGVLRAAVELPWARKFRIVRNHEQLLLERATTVFRGAAVLAWAYATLRAFGASGSFRALAEAFLAVRLHVGALDVTVSDAAAFVVTLWMSVWLSRALKFALDEAILPALDVTRGRAAAVSTTVKYLVVALGFSFAILAAGMEVTRVTVLVGTLGVGIGFGLQNIVRDFVCGLVLLYEQPMQVDDIIELGQLKGTVRRIGMRSSTVRTFDGAEVIVPNTNFVATEVVNWTHTDRLRRVDIAVNAAYGADPQTVVDLLLATARSAPAIAATPEPVALFTGFGDSALRFELRVWTPVDEWVANASKLRARISNAFLQAGIAIPFPQLDLWVRSAAAPVDKTIPGAARIEPPSFPRR